MNLERWQLGLTAALAATSLVSIFAAQALLAIATLVFGARLLTGRARLQRTPLDAPVLAYSVWTLLSASFSTDPLASHDSAKKLVLFAVVYLAMDSMASERGRERILDASLLGGIALAAGTLLQYSFLGFDTLDRRPHSFLGHYMTASGLAMGTMILATARLAFRRATLALPSRQDLLALGLLGAALAGVTLLRAADLFAVESERLFVAAMAASAGLLALSRGRWPGPATGTLLAAVAVPVCAWALVVSRTRNAWLGALAGMALLAFLRAPKALWLVPVGVAALLALRPATVVDRLTVTDASSLDRYYMWQAGVDMIRDKPVFGHGPGMVPRIYGSYRWPEAPNPQAAHLHDNVLQIAAERGIPCLVWWLWFVAAAMGQAWREIRRGRREGVGWKGPDPYWVARAALAILTSIMVAGLFEYNFGDSEILMFALLVAALPFTLARQRAVPA